MILFKKHESDNLKAVCLFMNGMPGPMKDREIFNDLAQRGVDIYSFYYPGTYNESGEFSIKNSQEAIEESLQKIDQLGLPVIIISYSYSTYFAQIIDWSKYKNIVSINLFSPIIGLDQESINDDFYNDIEELSKQPEFKFNIDFDSLKKEIPTAKIPNFSDNLLKLSELGIPVAWFYSTKDTIINVEKIDKEINDFRDSHSRNSFLVYAIDDGFHRLDSYYNRSQLPQPKLPDTPNKDVL